MSQTISQETLRKLQITELNILNEFDKVCKKLDIDYSLSSGTLIGAVRHSGFIPWDDDVDVAMLREDYDKFVEEGQALLPENLFIQTYETDKKYPFTWAKVRDLSTVLIENSTQAIKMKNGAFIDVFPIDRISSNRVYRWIDNQLLVFILAIKYSYTVEWIKNSRSRLRKIVRTLLFPLSKIIGTQKLSRLETFIRNKNNKESNEFTYGTAGYDTPPNQLTDAMLMPVSIFYFHENIMFENREFRAIKNRDEYLTITYGEYMKLPPNEKRKPHHNIIELKI